MPMRFSVVTLLLLAALALGGCEENVFRLVLRPAADGGLERELVCWREDTVDGKVVLKPFPAAELTRIAAAYGVAAPATGAQRFEFKGVVREETPPDVGGAGRWATLVSPLGRLHLYTERFRGRDDLEARLRRLETARDRGLTLLRGWLERNLAQEQGWNELAAFYDGEWRRDLGNVLLYALTGSLVAESGPRHGEGTADAAPQEATAARILLYLAERDYLRPQEVPAWMALFAGDAAPTDLAAWLGTVRQAVARKSGLAPEAPVLMALERLLAPATAGDSLRAYLRDTPEYGRAVLAWRAAHPDAPVEEAPDPVSAVLTEPVGEALTLSLWGTGGDRLQLRLALPGPPVASNGLWDAAAGQVAWNVVLPEAERLPVLAFAVAAVPDREAQQKSFGRTVLDGRALAEYVLWYRGLAVARAQAWDTMLAGVAGQPDPAAVIARFLAPPPDAPRSGDPYAGGRELLLHALGKP